MGAYLYEKEIDRLQRERAGEPILEVVEAEATDTQAANNGLLAATPSRLIYVRSLIVRVKKYEYPFDRLAHVSASPYGLRRRHTQILIQMYSGEVARYRVKQSSEQSSRERVQALLNAVHARTEDGVVYLAIT